MYPIIGSEAIASGELTRGQLRWNYAPVHPDVYIRKGQKRTLYVNTHAAWLWSGRRGIITGRAAAAMRGVYGMDAETPIEMIGRHGKPRHGIIVRADRIQEDEYRSSGGLTLTTAARTALDLGRYLSRELAVEYLDVLARSCGLAEADVYPLLQRYRGARGIPKARIALALMDAGTRCREESRFRLVLHDGGVPRPRTNISITGGRETTVIGMGWEDVKLGVSFFEPPRGGIWAAKQDLWHHATVQAAGWTEIGFVDLGQATATMCRARDELRRRRGGRL